MEMPIHRILFLGFLFIVLMPITTLLAEDTAIVRTAATVFGPSGLIFTQSADTLSPGKVEAGLSVTREHSSTDPDFSINEVSATMAFGLPGRIELAVHAPYMFNFESHGEDDAGMEGGDLSVKWRFLDQNVDLGLPALGLSLSYFFPIGNQRRGFEVVDSWGIKALLIASTEVNLSRSLYDFYYVGLYADGGIVGQHIGEPTEEKHGMVDLGILFPLTDSRRLQLILEGNATVKDQAPFEENYIAITGALRYMTAHIHLSGGIQHRFKQDTGIQDTDRFVFQAGYLF
ncbi:MAG: hypothetical protein AAB090_00800, partial [Nitrospirota bacterium]